MHPHNIGRAQLLDWINQKLDLSLTSLQQTSNGAFACYLLHAYQPGSINLDKVDYEARAEHRCLRNYRLLQAAFDKLDANKGLEVARLARGSSVAVFNFLQWLMAYLEPTALKPPSKICDLQEKKQYSSSTFNYETSRKIEKIKGGSRQTKQLSQAPLKTNAYRIAKLREEAIELELTKSALQQERDTFAVKMQFLDRLCATTILAAEDSAGNAAMVTATA